MIAPIAANPIRLAITMTKIRDEPDPDERDVLPSPLLVELESLPPVELELADVDELAEEDCGESVADGELGCSTTVPLPFDVL
jgi:hypothetical protein